MLIKEYIGGKVESFENYWGGKAGLVYMLGNASMTACILTILKFTSIPPIHFSIYFFAISLVTNSTLLVIYNQVYLPE